MDISPALIIAALLAAQIIFFAARQPCHRALEQLGRVLSSGLRLLSRSCIATARELTRGSQERLVEEGRMDLERRLERDFNRIDEGIAKSLQSYPDQHRALQASVQQIAADMTESASTPPEAPGWPAAVEAVNGLDGADRGQQRMLGNLRKVAVESERKILKAYRTETAKRHKILAGLGPQLKSVRDVMARTLTAVTTALETTRRVDGHMERYEQLRSGHPDARRTLAGEAVGAFIISALIMSVAIGGAFVNFQLIALPMSELVPAAARVGGMPVSSVAALVIVLMEVTAGVFLMEALGLTDLFPKIARLSRNQRRLIFGIAFGGLLVLAGIESSLAILREQIVEADIMLRHSLAGAAEASPARSNIPLVGQAVLGFVLPWILAMVAMPLEVLIASGRFVVARIVGACLVALGYFTRAGSVGTVHLSAMLRALFDVFIGVPLLIERLVRDRGTTVRAPRVATPRTREVTS